MTLIAPSILSADFARMGEEVQAVDAAGADWIHVDVMDGHFVGQITFGPVMVKAIRPHTRKRLDVHLMISPVDVYLAEFAAAGADLVTIHVEAGAHVHRSVQRARELGMGVGIALNPGTPVSMIEPLLDDVDMVLVMSVNPGFAGQKYIPQAVDRVRQVRQLIGTRPVLIEVDGGVSSANAGALVQAGADVLVAGSAVFAGGTPEHYTTNIGGLRSAADQALVAAGQTA